MLRFMGLALAWQGELHTQIALVYHKLEANKPSLTIRGLSIRGNGSVVSCLWNGIAMTLLDPLHPPILGCFLAASNQSSSFCPHGTPGGCLGKRKCFFD